MHEHDPHLTIELTAGTIQLTTPDGVSSEFQLTYGLTLWSEAGEHEAVNS